MSCYITTLLFFIFLRAFQCLDLDDLLTQNASLSWLRTYKESVESSNPYCGICCMNITYGTVGRKCGQHTMCVYSKKDYGPACKGLLAMDFTFEEKLVILDAHNTLRNYVAEGGETRGNPGPQPPASNMRIMAWDEELATIARKWARRCVYAHDTCRDTDRFPVGQNVARGHFAMKNDVSFIRDWYECVVLFENTSVNKYKPPNEDEKFLSQYSQLVWADSYLVGCARVAFQKAVDGKVTYVEHMVCNYGPSGNIPGQPVYQIGEACSRCMDGTGCTSTEYPALCGNEIIHDTMLQTHYRKKIKKMEAPNRTTTTRNTHLLKIYIIFSFLILI